MQRIKIIFWRDGVFPPDWRQIQATGVCFLLRAMDRLRSRGHQIAPDRHRCTAKVWTGSGSESPVLPTGKETEYPGNC